MSCRDCQYQPSYRLILADGTDVNSCAACLVPYIDAALQDMKEPGVTVTLPVGNGDN